MSRFSIPDSGVSYAMVSGGGVSGMTVTPGVKIDIVERTGGKQELCIMCLYSNVIGS